MWTSSRGAEIGRHKEIKEVGWNDPTNSTIYQWKTGQTTRSTAWTNTVRNRFRQKAGEIEAFRALEIGTAKWCREHIPHKGNNLHDITEEGISLLDDGTMVGKTKLIMGMPRFEIKGQNER
jgi:hypothetical protein